MIFFLWFVYTDKTKYFGDDDAPEPYSILSNNNCLL